MPYAPPEPNRDNSDLELGGNIVFAIGHARWARFTARVVDGHHGFETLGGRFATFGARQSEMSDVAETHVGSNAFAVALANNPPTDIALSQATVAENSANGTVVGMLSASDPDAGDTFTFTLLDDAGGRFAISGAALIVAGSLDCEAAPFHLLTVRVTDSGGATFDETIGIGVENVPGVIIIGTPAEDVIDDTHTVPGQPFPTNEEDTISGDFGADTISGLDGNDSLDGGQDGAADLLIGGTGNDSFIIDELTDAVIENVGEGTDKVYARVSYTLGPNVENLELQGPGLVGTGNELNNWVIGGDIVAGLGGADILQGATADYSASPAGVAVYLPFSHYDGFGFGGDAQGDILKLGLTGVVGSAFGDVLIGGDRGETLSGGLGDDVLRGSYGNDTLMGGDGSDVLWGDFGANVLDGGPGDDTLHGYFGADVYRFSSLSDLSASGDHITYFGPLHRIDLSSIAGLQFIGNAAFSGVAGQVRYAFESSTTHILIDSDGDSAFDKRIVIDNGKFEFAETFASSNVLIGSIANSPPTDIALSQSSVEENSANGTVVGLLTATDPDGGDVLTFSLLDDAGGRFAISSGSLVVAGLIDYETAMAHSVTVRVTDLGGAFYDETFNITVNDVATGFTIVGTAGSDTISAVSTPPGQQLPTNDNDTVDGLGGMDSMAAGQGNDTYIADNTGDVVTENANEGMDLVRASASFTLGPDVENLELTGTGAINGTGNSGVNAITGNPGNNVLAGLGGGDSLNGGAGRDTASYSASPSAVSVNLSTGAASGGDAQGDTLLNMENIIGSSLADTLIGNSASNTLMGGAGADLLYGASGNDRLTGGTGADRVYGAAGVDEFVFATLSEIATGAQLDLIGDFSSAQGDKINVSAIDANSQMAGNQTFIFINADGFSGIAGQLGYTAITGGVRVRGDINGDSAADFSFTVLGTAPVAADFFL